jgi:uncharacterized protein YceK
MKKLISLLAMAALLTGCASVVTEQIETDETGYTRHTKFKARTFWDSKNELTKARTTMTDKTQGVAVSGLEQEASGTNATALIERVVGAAVRGAVGAAAP